MNSFLDNQLEFDSFWNTEPNYKSNLQSLKSYKVSSNEEYKSDDRSKMSYVSSYQYQLKLESQDEYIKSLKRAISNFKDYEAYRMVYSNRWENLITSLEKEEDLLEQFKDIMAMLKLRGYNM